VFQGAVWRLPSDPGFSYPIIPILIVTESQWLTGILLTIYGYPAKRQENNHHSHILPDNQSKNRL
jgi:hypothetical protein